MGKIKSAIALVLTTVLLAGLCFMCTAVFPHGTENISMFNNFVAMTEKDPKLGNALPEGYTASDGRTYIGGGYTAVYYPEGVISAREFTETLAGKKDALENTDPSDKSYEDRQKDVKDYETGYMAYPEGNASVYLEIEKACEGGKVTEKFQADFEGAVAQLRARVEELHLSGAAVSVRDNFTAQVFVPSYKGTPNTLVYALTTFARTGEFSIGYGDSNSTADTATKLELGEGESIRDYVKSARANSNVNGSYVDIRLTGKGKNLISGWTTGASSDSAVTIYFYVGDEAIVNLSVDSHITERSLTVYSASYDELAASAVAATIDSALKAGKTEMTFSSDSIEIVREGAAFGDLTLILLCAGVGALLLAELIFFFVKFRGVGLANLYAMLTYVSMMILLVWAIPFLHIGVETFLAVGLGGALLAVSNYVTYESAKKEYALGKTMTSSVKAGYKRCFFGVFDVHIALALIAFITYFIALTELASFAFTFGLAVVLSGLCSLAVSRFHWAAFMSFAKDKGKFCNFKRVEEDDE